MVLTTFWIGFIIIALPILLVTLWECGREKIQNLWLDGYSAGYRDGGK